MTLAVGHFLLRYDFYIRFRPTKWLNEPIIKLRDKEIRPEAAFEKGMPFGKRKLFREVQKGKFPTAEIFIGDG
jgi:hypothetical protein